MKKDFIKTIIDKKLSCVIISPHNDDALLSVSALIEALSGKTKITVVTVFTKAHKKPYTLSAKAFLESTGFTDARSLYEKRKQEDKEAFSEFSVNLINLELEDALFRTKKRGVVLGKIIPEFDHVYPTYRWHIQKGYISSQDQATEQLKNKLQQFSNKKNIIFAPMGIGNHVDHILVREVCEELFDKVIYYSDFPYNVRLNNFGKAKSGFDTVSLMPDLKEKEKKLRCYSTQFNGLFPTGNMPEHKEVYFVPKDL
jgi:LmbE family N-acetylglucosaminyl deacetylase